MKSKIKTFLAGEEINKGDLVCLLGGKIYKFPEITEEPRGTCKIGVGNCEVEPTDYCSCGIGVTGHIKDGIDTCSGCGKPFKSEKIEPLHGPLGLTEKKVNELIHKVNRL